VLYHGIVVEGLSSRALERDVLEAVDPCWHVIVRPRLDFGLMMMVFGYAAAGVERGYESFHATTDDTCAA